LAGVSRESDHRARLRAEYRAEALAVVLREAGEAYGAEGVPFTVTESEVRDALRAHGRGHAGPPPLDLAVVAAYLDRTFGGRAGATRAEQELREAITRAIERVPPIDRRDLRHDAGPVFVAPAPKGHGALALRANSEARFQREREYSYRTKESAPRVLAQIGQALTLLGQSVDFPRLRDVTRDVIWTRGVVISRARYDLGCSLALVTYATKIHVEMPTLVLRHLIDWLEAGVVAAAG
jgi:hypothetical protein